MHRAHPAVAGRARQGRNENQAKRNAEVNSPAPVPRGAATMPTDWDTLARVNALRKEVAAVRQPIVRRCIEALVATQARADAALQPFGVSVPARRFPARRRTISSANAATPGAVKPAFQR